MDSLSSSISPVSSNISFGTGVLSAPPGTTLRNYLSEKLNCDPMRITKKFTGDASIGKRVFHPSDQASSHAVE